MDHRAAIEHGHRAAVHEADTSHEPHFEKPAAPRQRPAGLTLMARTDRAESARPLGSSQSTMRLVPQTPLRKALNKQVVPANGHADPNGSYMARWDLVTTFFLLFTAIVTPVEVGFTRQLGGDPEQWAIWWLNRLVDVVFIKDIVVQFFLPYQDETRGGMVIRSRILIAKRYLKGWFWIDFVSVIPFDLIPVDALNKLKAVRLVKLLKLLKLGRVLRANRTLARWESSIAISYAKISMYTFALGIVFVSHWMACLWGLVDVMAEKDAWTWVRALEAAKSDPRGKGGEGRPTFRVVDAAPRIAALYFSVYTLTSIGYGDITATNPTEFCVATFFIFFGSFFWAYTIGSFCATLATMDIYEVQWKQTMDEMNEMMSDRNFDQDLRRRCRMFMKNAKHLAKAANYRQLEQQMSLTLRSVAAAANNQTWLANCWYLSPPTLAEINPTFIADASQCLTIRLFAPLELVEVPISLCILNSGIVARNGKPMGKGMVWGHDFVLRDEHAHYIDKTYGSSLTYAEIVTLERTDFFAILDQGYPEENKAVRLAQTFYRIKACFLRHVADYVQAKREGRTGQRNLAPIVGASPTSFAPGVDVDALATLIAAKVERAVLGKVEGGIEESVRATIGSAVAAHGGRQSLAMKQAANSRATTAFNNPARSSQIKRSVYTKFGR
ncbi:voltage-gated potassium channel [Aureococcus anophagefferens]|nr:voltage-gated potassium channel [Aureococcus anophagefferens]